MCDGSNGGIYQESSGTWVGYWNNSNACLGIAGSTTSSSYKLYVNGSVYSTGSVVAASDIRLKENIEPIKGALAKVKNLVGVCYNMIDDEKKKRRVGFIAQQTDPHLPEVVYYDKENDRYGVNYGDVTAILAEAIKELDEKVERLLKGKE